MQKSITLLDGLTEAVVSPTDSVCCSFAVSFLQMLFLQVQAPLKQLDRLGRVGGTVSRGQLPLNSEGTTEQCRTW